MQGMSRRANFKNKIADSVEHFWKDREIYYALFERFLGDVKAYIDEEIAK
jgi:hypothetical protein